MIILNIGHFSLRAASIQPRPNHPKSRAVPHSRRLRKPLQSPPGPAHALEMEGRVRRVGAQPLEGRLRAL